MERAPRLSRSREREEGSGTATATIFPVMPPCDPTEQV